MINKIKIRMLLTNSVILFSVILAISIFVFISFNLNIITNSDNEMILRMTELRRYIPLMEKKTDRELEEEFSLYLEALNSGSQTYCVFDENFNVIKKSDALFLDTDTLKSVALLVFSENPKEKRKVVNQSREILYIHEYSALNMNVRICTAAVSDETGKMRITQILSNMDVKYSISNRLLRTLIITGFLGMIASFFIGLFITSKAMVPIEESIRKQKEFVADASHELRTPLTVLRTNLDVILSSPEETVSSQEKWLDNAYKETESMEQLISDLLILARSDLNTELLDKKAADLNEIVKSAADRMKELASKKNIVIDVSEKTENIKVSADTMRIIQLMTIIIDNAINYSPFDSKISVCIEKPKGMQYARVSICDEGIGFEPEDMQKVFERFYRSDKARSRSEGGTGLGLSIAKWIVESHKGTISAANREGKGAKIVFELPAGEETK